MLNGSPFRILSGEVHYARVHPDYWHDRLQVCGGLSLRYAVSVVDV